LIGLGRAVSPKLPQDGRLGEASPPIFDSIIVVTDRRILDQQIRNTIRQFAQVGATVGAVKEGDGSKTKQLSEYLDQGKKIIIVTVQTFPVALDKIGTEHRGKNFAILIDEAHSSQGGRTSAAVSMALGTAVAEEDEETTEDKINRLIEAKKLLPNASYFAFTATPKNKTLEIFGEPEPQPDGTELFKQFMDNESFRRWMTDTVFRLTYEPSAAEGLQA
jgi:type I restriction enzyme R subunit